eukprot:177020-Karenia_brevis.AAC.1
MLRLGAVVFINNGQPVCTTHLLPLEIASQIGPDPIHITIGSCISICERVIAIEPSCTQLAPVPIIRLRTAVRTVDRVGGHGSQYCGSC